MVVGWAPCAGAGVMVVPSLYMTLLGTTRPTPVPGGRGVVGNWSEARPPTIRGKPMLGPSTCNMGEVRTGTTVWTVTFVAVAVTTLSSTRLLISDQICLTLDPEISRLIESLPDKSLTRGA